MINRTLRLAKGYENFRQSYFKDHEEEFIRLSKEGQSPKTLFIGCSDSRLVPDLILGTKPGELFVIRTAGNFVPFYSPHLDDGVSATIQYAVEVLNVKDIIICGHSHCGAIKGLFDPPKDDGKLNILTKWLRFGEKAKKTTLELANIDSEEDKYTITEQMSVLDQLEHLMTFPFVKERVENNRLHLHGWYFKVQTGNVSYYDFEHNEFKPLSM